MSDSAQPRTIVSFDDEPLILVDDQDNAIGHLDKKRCHEGDGLLHRAFSVFLFDPEGRLLLQQRSREKKLWPLYWSNSCCSHPRRGESMHEAVSRRLREELDLRVMQTRFLFKFRYSAAYGTLGSENEVCSVFVGVTRDKPQSNTREIEAIRWVSSETMDQETNKNPEHFTPWSLMEWQRIRNEFLCLTPAAAVS